MKSLTYACFECRKTFRLGGRAESHRCPFCGSRLRHIHHAPPLSKPSEWEALQRKHLRREHGIQVEAVHRVNGVVAQIRRLELLEEKYPAGRLRRVQKAKRKAEQHRKKLASTLGGLAGK